jgi:hypothetical protein
MTKQTTPRRSHWQALAHKKYPRMMWLGGDGGFECWVVLTKCPHEQTRYWRYALRPSKAEAEALMAVWDAERCGYQCQGIAAHILWRIYD